MAERAMGNLRTPACSRPSSPERQVTFIDSKRAIRIRLRHGLNFSRAVTTSPIPRTRIVTRPLNRFHEIWWPAGPFADSLTVAASMRRPLVSTTKSIPDERGIHKGAAAPLVGGAECIGACRRGWLARSRAFGLGGTRPPRLSPWGNGKGGSTLRPAARLRSAWPCGVLPRARLPFALAVARDRARAFWAPSS